MRFFVSVYYWLFFVSTILVGIGVATVTWLATMPFDCQRRTVHWLICHWGHQYLRAWPLWSTRVLHRERLPKQPCVIIANHQSMADIIAVLGLYYPFKFVSKASLFGVPVLGWLMKMAKYVSVERGRVKSMNEMMETCRAWLRAGMSVMIFPEGTRSADGEIKPFKEGAFRLALETGYPILPIAVAGSRDTIPKNSWVFGVQCQLRIEVLPPIEVKGLTIDDLDALRDRVRTTICSAFERLGKWKPTLSAEEAETAVLADRPALSDTSR